MKVTVLNYSPVSDCAYYQVGNEDIGYGYLPDQNGAVNTLYEYRQGIMLDYIVSSELYDTLITAITVYLLNN